MKYKYNVSISLIKKSDKKVLQGLLQYNDNGNIINYEFSPDSVLCDLSIFKYNKETDSNYNKNHYIDEVVFKGYSREEALNNIKIDKHKDLYYYPLAQLIKKQILNYETFTIKDIEKLRIYFDVKLNYTISYKDKTKLFRKKEVEDFIPLQYGFCDIDKFLDKRNKRLENKYIYYCNNLSEVLFAILHYLIYNGYYFIGRCNHCNKLYFYRHRGSCYCLRKSPYEKYKHLNCEQAVRNIKYNLTRRYNSHVETLDIYYPDDKQDFIIDYKKLKDIADKCSSVNNLLALERFLNEAKKYKRHKIQGIGRIKKN